jgi:hypothetical protein
VPRATRHAHNCDVRRAACRRRDVADRPRAHRHRSTCTPRPGALESVYSEFCEKSSDAGAVHGPGRQPCPPQVRRSLTRSQCCRCRGAHYARVRARLRAELYSADRLHAGLTGKSASSSVYRTQRRDRGAWRTCSGSTPSHRQHSRITGHLSSLSPSFVRLRASRPAPVRVRALTSPADQGAEYEDLCRSRSWHE